MSEYRPLLEPTEENRARGIYEPNENGHWLTKHINDALNYLHILAVSILGVEKSITIDDETKKVSLVNDLDDEELEAQNKDLVFGYSKTNKARGWKEDTGGKVGTKEVDETNIATGKMLEYDGTTDKIKYVVKPSGSEAGAGFLLLPYKLWREAIGYALTGYMDVQLQISTSPLFATTVYNIDSGSAQENWKCFSASSGTYIEWDASGMPATDVMGIVYTGTLTLTKGYYARWRTYEHGTSNYTDWLPLGVI